MIPYGRQDITQADVDAVTAVLQSDFLTQGPCVPRFEQGVLERVGANYAFAVNSATSGLHIACMALGLGPSDLLWTVPNTFVASANCALYCGAQVDFVDIDPKTWNMSVAALRDKLQDAKAQGRLPKIVVPVHFGGQPTDQEDIWALAQEFGFKVIEDASHSIGANRNGEPVGSGRWSHVTIFSFHPVKIITSGEGGMVLCNDEAVATRLAMLRTHGITRDTAQFSVEPVPYSGSGPDYPGWYYEQQMLGFNYRMTDIHAALGLSQLQRIDDYIEQRNQLALQYQQAFEGMPLELPYIAPGNRSAFHLYVVRLAVGTSTDTHRNVFDRLREAGVGCNLHYLPVHLQPYYRALGFGPGQFLQAESHAQRAITLPLHPTMTQPQHAQVVDSVRAVLDQAGC